MKKLWTRARTWTIVSLRRMCTTSREISKDSHFIAHYARLFMPHVTHLCHPRAAVLVLFAMLQEKCFIISKWREQFSFNILLDDTFFLNGGEFLSLHILWATTFTSSFLPNNTHEMCMEIMKRLFSKRGRKILLLFFLFHVEENSTFFLCSSSAFEWE